MVVLPVPAPADRHEKDLPRMAATGGPLVGRESGRRASSTCEIASDHPLDVSALHADEGPQPGGQGDITGVQRSSEQITLVIPGVLRLSANLPIGTYETVPRAAS
jgi:hypothetical protein